MTQQGGVLSAYGNIDLTSQRLISDEKVLLRSVSMLKVSKIKMLKQI